MRLLCLLYDKTADDLGLVVLKADNHSLAPRPVALQVAIAVVRRGSQRLLVYRRDVAGGKSWQFPTGIVKPGADAAAAAVQETLAETGVHCVVVRPLGSRLHPVTLVHCQYFLCEFLAGEAENRDVVENVDVAWVEQAQLGRFIDRATAFPAAFDPEPSIGRRLAGLSLRRSMRGGAEVAHNV